MRAAKVYNPPLLFIAGVLSFCLGILVGIFNAIDKLKEEPAALLGYVLIWISITAFVAMLSALVLQIKKHLAPEDAPAVPAADPEKAEHLRKRKRSDCFISLLTAAPIVPGIFTVVACVRVGGAVMEKTATMPTFWEALCKAVGVVI